MKFNRLFVAALFGIFSTSALADRVVTDQLDRQVTIPDHIQRAVVLQPQYRRAIRCHQTNCWGIIKLEKTTGAKLCAFSARIRKNGHAGRFKFSQY